MSVFEGSPAHASSFVAASVRFSRELSAQCILCKVHSSRWRQHHREAAQMTRHPLILLNLTRTRERMDHRACHYVSSLCLWRRLWVYAMQRIASSYISHSCMAGCSPSTQPGLFMPTADNLAQDVKSTISEPTVVRYVARLKLVLRPQDCIAGSMPVNRATRTSLHQ